MYASRTFYCHELRLRRSPLLRSSFLLIKWRSLRGFLCTDSHANMESAPKKPRVNCNPKKQEQPQDAWICCTLRLFYKSLPFTRAIRKSASSMLSAALQLFLLIEWRSLRTLLRSDFRASTESERRRVRVNCNKFSLQKYLVIRYPKGL